MHKLHSQTFFTALGVYLCACNAQKCWAPAELQLLEPSGGSCVCLPGWHSCCKSLENAGFHLWGEIAAAVSTGSQFSGAGRLSPSQRFCDDASLRCWAFRVDFLRLLHHHDGTQPNRAKLLCQAPFLSNAGFKFGPGESHIFPWEFWLLCWELHLLNLEGLHYVLVAGLCFVLSRIFSANAGGCQLSCSVMCHFYRVLWYWCVLDVFISSLLLAS